MADRRRAELAELVKDACEGLEECGFSGLLETPVLKIFTDAHKLNAQEPLSNLIAALEGTATRMIAGKAPPNFPELMVMSQVLIDVEGPAAPPEGSDSPLDSEFKSLVSNLRLALCAALLQFARPGSQEAREGVELAAGMLIMLLDKVSGDQLVALAVEHALLRLLSRRKACVMLLRDRTWSLNALNAQVAALKDYDPEKEEDGEAPEDGEGQGGSEEDQDAIEEEGEEEDEEEPEEAEEADGEADGEA